MAAEPRCACLFLRILIYRKNFCQPRHLFLGVCEDDRGRQLDHLRGIWRSRVSAPVADSNTVEDQKRRSRKSASLTYNLGRHCCRYSRLVFHQMIFSGGISMSHVRMYRCFLGLAILVLSALVSSAEVSAQGMQQKSMERMPGMGDGKARDNRLRQRNGYRHQYSGSKDHLQSWPDTGNKMARYENGISGRAIG